MTFTVRYDLTDWAEKETDGQTDRLCMHERADAASQRC